MGTFLDLVVPSRCDGCGAAAPPPWCAACAAVAASLRPPAPCPSCAGPEAPGHACVAPGFPVDAVVALTTWRDPVARALTHAKLAGRAEVHRHLGRRLATLLQDRCDLVVPVPTDRRRARERGHDHTLVLARAVASALGVPAVPALATDGPQPDRAGGRDPGAVPRFRATRHTDRVVGRAVWLVDDLVTTGTTAAAAATALRSLVPAQVGLAVLARAGGHRLGAGPVVAPARAASAPSGTAVRERGAAPSSRRTGRPVPLRS